VADYRAVILLHAKLPRSCFMDAFSRMCCRLCQIKEIGRVKGLFEDSSPASQDQRLFPVMSGIRSSSLTKMVRYVQGSRVEHVLYAYTKMVCSLAGS